MSGEDEKNKHIKKWITHTLGRDLVEYIVFLYLSYSF